LNLQSVGYCSKCKKETKGQSRGVQHRCSICCKHTTKGIENKQETFSSDGYSAQYVVSSEKRITSIDELESLCTFDKNVWKIVKWEQEAGVSEGYRKDKKTSWHIHDGKVTGDVEDSGKMLVVPLHSFRVRIWLSRKTDEIRNNLIVNEFTVKALKVSPVHKKIKYEKVKDGNLFELSLPDMQLGRLVAAEDAGFDLSPEIQIKRANLVVDKLISYCNNFEIERIVFPVGNDFFDTNNEVMATAHGTPQDDDVRWKRTYKLGCEFVVGTILKMQEFAKVDVMVIPGNHDQDKIWHLGEYVSAWFHNSKNVSVDNRPMKRKYYGFYKNLIGFTHGYFEKNNKLDSLMAYEVPELWAASTNREWHLGDKHHKVDMILKTNELENGVVIRIISSLATPSVWEFDKGFVGSKKAGEAFLWHKDHGVIAQFTDSGK